MFALGVIGEYLGRLFFEIKKRPQPFIGTLINDHRENPRKWLGKMTSQKISKYEEK
jgi:hypothetical protein